MTGEEIAAGEGGSAAREASSLASSTEGNLANSASATKSAFNSATSNTEDDPKSNIIRELICERDAITAERDDFKDSLLRLKADFENFKRRVRDREQQTAEQAEAEFAEKLIPVLEGLEAAVSATTSDKPKIPAQSNISAQSNIPDQSGIEQISKLFFSTLEAEGMEALRPHGEPFDPNLHEAIEHVPAETAEVVSPEKKLQEKASDGVPVVVEVFRTGYRWKGRLLRPALVKVQG